MRLRPYVYYKEGTLIPEKEEKHAGEGSWPSGHTSLGWTTALLLIDINPAATDGIMARAYEHGQSRVIVGYHWQTDVDAARLGWHHTPWRKLRHQAGYSVHVLFVTEGPATGRTAPRYPIGVTLPYYT